MIGNTSQLIEALPRQRWFGSKDRAIERVDVLDEVVVSEDPPDIVFALVSVVFADGGRRIYQVVLKDAGDGPQADAVADADSLRLIGDLMARGATFTGGSGDFHFGGPGLDPLAPPGHESARAVVAEQSNSSLVLDDSVIVKFFRRLEPGPNPDLELNRLLTNEGFENIPAHVGEIIYEGRLHGDDTTFDLAIAQQFIADGADGWSEMLAALHRLYDGADDVEEDALTLAVEERSHDSFESIAELGNVTASLHVLLSREEMEPDISPEEVDDQDLKEWAERAQESLAQMAATDLPDLRELTEVIEARVDRLKSVEEPGKKARVHGDYHLGQVIRSPRGWMIIDLEGEPVRSIEERRAKQSPLRDVAGMLRSFSYAASASLFERSEPESTEWQRLEPWAYTWEAIARDRFVTAYLSRSHEGTFLPPNRDDLLEMLDVFEIDKALYELAYEQGHRPEWIRIPVRGILEVIGRDKKR